jgi:hypothetical protein
MFSKKKHLISIIIIISTIFQGVSFNIKNVSAAANLNGRILLQVQSHGEAWYVNPLNSRRYYLGRPADAYNVMRNLGLGISNKDFSTISNSSTRLAGRILIKVEDSGRAYYFDPSNLKLYYLGRPDDAFQVMRQRGLGITNSDLSKILVATNSSPAPTVTTSQPTIPSTPVVSPGASSAFTYNFKYKNIAQTISLDLSSSLYQSYSKSPKVLTYQSDNEPPNLRESFYGLFLKLKSGDTSIDSAIYKLKAIALQNNLSSDEIVNLVMAWVQYIPYDQAKLNANVQSNNNPYYPYETIYLDRGVCSDKTFLAVVLLRKLGYGAAILDFPDLNHTAAGIQCPVDDSMNSSGYCYIETTNYFPVGVIPQTINSGQAQSTTNEFVNLFSSANLGKIEILQKTTGKVYQGMATVKAQADSLKTEKNYLSAEEVNINNLASALKIKENSLSDLKAELDTYYNSGQISMYNSLISNYNSAVNSYNADLSVYRAKVEDYNKRANIFYQASKDFYQQ